MMIRRAQPWLGTLVSIGAAATRDAVVDADLESIGANAAIDAAFSAVARVHRAMSVHDPASDASRFNSAHAAECVDCDAWTIKLLMRAAELHRATQGLFDVTLGTSTRRPWRIESRTRVRKIDARARIDLGGIAKGWAVDRAVCALRAAGVRAGWVDAGGDLRVFGPMALHVAIRDARIGDRAAITLELERGGLATSQYADGHSISRGDALIHPSRGQPHRVHLGVTVAAATCTIADALTKVIALTADAHHPLLARWHARAWIA